MANMPPLTITFIIFASLIEPALLALSILFIHIPGFVSFGCNMFFFVFIAVRFNQIRFGDVACKVLSLLQLFLNLGLIGWYAYELYFYTTIFLILPGLPFYFIPSFGGMPIIYVTLGLHIAVLAGSLAGVVVSFTTKEEDKGNSEMTSYVA